MKGKPSAALRAFVDATVDLGRRRPRLALAIAVALLAACCGAVASLRDEAALQYGSG